jgi:serine/threonine-protein kinase RsbW
MSDKERVILSVPARGEFARTVRLTAAELAARTGMNIDDVDDVKLAVEEAFVFACGRDSLDEVTFSFLLGDASLELTVGPLPKPCDDADEAEPSQRYARFILESVCDEYEFVERDGACWVRLVKRVA